MSEVKNLFTEQSEAERYDQYRPFYHEILANKLLEYFGHKKMNVLDVACGTGHSTKALSRISENITGIDLSEAMLSVARKKSNNKYLISKAEKTPFDDNSFDYVHSSMAYQWFQQIDFLNEARRILKPNGFLGIDNYGFTGLMIGDPNFTADYVRYDQQNMNMAPRNKNFPDEVDLEKSKFKLVHEIIYDHDVQMNKDQFINYLMTRSNFLNLSFQDRNSVQKSLADFYKPYFDQTLKTLLFKGRVRLYQEEVTHE